MPLPSVWQMKVSVNYEAGNQWEVTILVSWGLGSKVASTDHSFKGLNNECTREMGWQVEETAGSKKRLLFFKRKTTLIRRRGSDCEFYVHLQPPPWPVNNKLLVWEYKSPALMPQVGLAPRTPGDGAESTTSESSSFTMAWKLSEQ